MNQGIQKVEKESHKKNELIINNMNFDYFPNVETKKFQFL